MKKLLVLPLLLSFSVPAIAHNEFNGGDAMHCGGMGIGCYPQDVEEGEEGPIRENIYREDGKCFGICY